MTTYRIAVFVAAISLVGAAACGSAGTKGGAGSGPALSSSMGHTQVTVKIYSGRENPTWVLDSAAAASLVAAVNGLTVSDRASSEIVQPSALGFQGFDVSNLETTHGLGTVANVSAHQVTLTLANSNTITLDDPGSSAANVLLADATRHLPADLVNTIKEQLK